MAGQTKRLRVDVSNADDPTPCGAATRFRLLAEPVGTGATLPATSWSPAAEVSAPPGGSASTELAFALPADFTGSLQFYLDVANAELEDGRRVLVAFPELKVTKLFH